jgi:hypothetical protein
MAFDLSHSLFGLIIPASVSASVSLEDKGQPQKRPEEKPFALANVIPVLIAAWLAHSIVVMGYTDRSKGCFMLQTLLDFGFNRLIRSWI